MKIAIKAEVRKAQGTGASRRLRRADKVPGIVYGGGKDATVVELDHNDLFHKLKLEAFHASILDMSIDGKSEQVLLRDVQMHAWKQNVLHVDFQRVSADKKLHMKVPLHFINADVAPGVKLSGGIVSHIINELDISCLPKDLPEFIEVDLKDLAAGHSIHISNLKMPAGVESVALHRGDDQSVATIIIPRAVAAEEEAAPAVSAADVPAANQKAKDEEKKDDKAAGKDKK
ncbi:MAG: 50S ribosomal protein L25/general stress protein Ctc [Betaproteobacteria bacterium]|nr:50S ribosomal protein L25/general stress protein Ctc [Betaproteobacteria bacterium]